MIDLRCFSEFISYLTSRIDSMDFNMIFYLHSPNSYHPTIPVVDCVWVWQFAYRATKITWNFTSTTTFDRLLLAVNFLCDVEMNIIMKRNILVIARKMIFGSDVWFLACITVRTTWSCNHVLHGSLKLEFLLKNCI